MTRDEFLKRLRRGLDDIAPDAIDDIMSDYEAHFDAAPASLDYELSALFVRFLLLDRELSPRFRAWLAAQTVEPRSPESLPAALAIGWPSLERRFASWVAGP